MAKKPEPVPEPAPVEDALPSAPKSYRVHIMLGLVVIALAETILIYLIIPSPERLKRDIIEIQQTAIKADGEGIYGNISTEITPDPDVKRVPLVEKSLGDKFKVQTTRPDEQLTDVFTASIQVQIARKDEAAFDKLYLERQYTIRDAVTTVLRASTMAERQENALTSIKRKVQKAINDVLEIGYVKGVLFTDAIPETI